LTSFGKKTPFLIAVLRRPYANPLNNKVLIFNYFWHVICSNKGGASALGGTMRFVPSNITYRFFALFLTIAMISAACTETKVVETVIEKPGATNNSGTPESPAAKPAETPVTVEGGAAVLTKDVIGPKVVSTNPANSYQEVSPTTAVTVTFSESLDPATVTENTISLKDAGGNAVAGTWHYDEASKSVSIVPSKPLLDSEQYTVSVSSNVRDLSGNERPLSDTIIFRVADLKTIAIAVGSGHMLALKENKTVWAWGRNHWGQVGDGTTTDRNRPVRVQGLSNVSAIAAANHNSFALVDGEVWAWGANASGQIGDGTTTHRTTPFKIPGLSNVTAIAAADSVGYALLADGSVWAWGSNRRGVLGNGKGTGDNNLFDSPVPVRVLLDQPAIQISGGMNFAMALTQDPTTKETSVWVWGHGAQGQRGDKITAIAAKPVQTLDTTGSAPLHGIKSVTASGGRAMALTDSGEVLAWGSNLSGQVGNNSVNNQTLPVKITGPENIVKLAGGTTSQSSFAVTQDGQVWAWGNNSTAQLLFYSTGGKELTPRKISITSPVADIQTSSDFAAYLFADGSIMTTGLNINGQLGHGTASFYSYHPNLTRFPDAKQVSGRLILAKDGTVWAMGRNVDCELGLPNHGAEVMTPIQIAIPAKITMVANSGMHMLALDETKNVWAWGSNAKGELGSGTTGSDSCTPQRVKSPDGKGVLDNVEYIAAGSPIEINAISGMGASMAIRKIPNDPNNATELFAWGGNYNGLLGVPTSTPHSPLPLKVAGLPDNVTQVSLAANILAVTSDGLVYSWGRNTSGQLCLGSASSGTHIPQKTSFSNVKQVAAGSLFSLIVLNDGTLKSCGNNVRGQLGIGWDSVLSADQTLEIQTVHNISNVIFAAAANYTSFAITADGQLWGWGNNAWGQLGTGNTSIQNVPSKVLMRNGTPFSNITAVSIYGSDNTGDWTSVITAIRNDGSVWDWGYLRTPFTYLVREGESAISPPQVVNWP
jgi:alpha-tubulin suppressor-like RCC1 family protein